MQMIPDILKSLARCLACFALAVIFAAALTPAHTAEAAKFPVPNYTQLQYNFWRAIFNKYPSHSAVIHDARLPDVIIDVIDFKKRSASRPDQAPLSRRQRKKTIDRYVKRYETALRRFAKYGKQAVKHGPMEERVWAVYSRTATNTQALLSGKTTIRSQFGLADTFRKAAKTAHMYLPYMEKIFKSYGLPTELTRMVFVESMFNTKARSRVGASGMWQFMPRTAKSYMKVNHWIDERNSPIKATHAAAKLLKSNFQILKSWPLAITAYNHGATGMKRAARRLRTKDMGRISRSYRSRTFGFASRNFYAEFLAARDVYKLFHENNRKHKPNPLKLAKITLKKPISIAQLVKDTPLTKTILKTNNPCLSKKAFTNYRFRKLPRGYQLFIPDKMLKRMKPSRKLVATTNGYGNLL